jgi:hypothetical protein
MDYVLKSPASTVTLEIFDAQQNLVRRLSSEDKRSTKRAPLPVAERWLPKPEVIEKSPGMHRFVWSLTWASSGGPIADDDSDVRNPSGPKVIPGDYQVRLTVDGQSQTQMLNVVMDPRSPATPEVLTRQFQLGKQIFDETIKARRVLAEISSIQKQLTEAQQKPEAQGADVKTALATAQSSLSKIRTGKKDPPEAGRGLEDAYKDLASALRVVEGGDRLAPSQAIAVFNESSQQIKARVGEWISFKQSRLPELNRLLRQANLPSIAIAEVGEEVELLWSR